MPSLDVPHLAQARDGWCLPACVAMVTAYLEEPLLQEDVARWLGTSEIGTPASSIRRLTRFGYDVLLGDGSLANLEYWLRERCPPILFVRTGDLAYWSVDTPHAVVLAGTEADNATLYDPGMATGPNRATIGELVLAWSHFDYAFAILRSARS